jgi:hypothetical protein
MFRSAKRLLGFAIKATDGVIGDVENLFFDNEKWVVRYIVLASGSLFSGRQTLVSPISISTIDGDRKLIFTDLTMKQIENAPGIENKKPISRRQEHTFNRYYNYLRYWTGSGLWGEDCHPRSLAGVVEQGEMPFDEYDDDDVDCHLRSIKEVLGYTVLLQNGEKGPIRDFLIDESTWAVSYLNFSTRGLQRWKKRLYQPGAGLEVSWPEQKIYIQDTSTS